MGIQRSRIHVLRCDFQFIPDINQSSLVENVYDTSIVSQPTIHRALTHTLLLSIIRRNCTFLTTPTCLPRLGTEYDLRNHSLGRRPSEAWGG
jgi:hypothetical protein